LWKIRQLAFAIVHSTTIALPAWRKACKEKGKSPRLIPRDVRTRWNSLYDMLVVATEYKEVVNTVTGDRNLDLRKYDVSDAEWTILEDMVFTLKYYSATEESNVYRIAMVLHPSLKIEYFKLPRWEQPWIQTAEDVVRDEYKVYLAAGEGAEANIIDADAVCSISLIITITNTFLD
ncbi:hypothetical protein GGX14DRAFT_380169, partial [Mycena pura]